MSFLLSVIGLQSGPAEALIIVRWWFYYTSFPMILVLGYHFGKPKLKAMLRKLLQPPDEDKEKGEDEDDSN